eukprot:m.23865 g.23865  ORF g.23865 m.23865 type:complete len:453 (+) comp11441_c0_seq1:39-1397(+)
MHANLAVNVFERMAFCHDKIVISLGLIDASYIPTVSCFTHLSPFSFIFKSNSLLAGPTALAIVKLPLELIGVYPDFSPRKTMRRSYGSCIALAMVSASEMSNYSASEGLTVKQICAFFEHFQDEIPATQRPRWRNGVRHALSGHSCFYQPTKENHLWCMYSDELPRAAKAAVDTYQQLKAAMPDIEHDTAIRCVLGGISPAALRLNTMISKQKASTTSTSSAAAVVSSTSNTPSAALIQAPNQLQMISLLNSNLPRLMAGQQQPAAANFNPLAMMLQGGGAPPTMAAWPVMMPMSMPMPMPGGNPMLAAPATIAASFAPAMQQQLLAASLFQQQAQQQQAMQMALMQQAASAAASFPSSTRAQPSQAQFQMQLQGIQSHQLQAAASTQACVTAPSSALSLAAAQKSACDLPSTGNKLQEPRGSDQSDEIAHVPSTPQSESSAPISQAASPLA